MDEKKRNEYKQNIKEKLEIAFDSTQGISDHELKRSVTVAILTYLLNEK